MNEATTVSRIQSIKPLMFGKLCLLSFSIAACAPGSDAAENRAFVEVNSDITTPAKTAVGEVPAELLSSIIEDLITSENMQRDTITVERAESVIWPDGALGCPKPGDMYTHAQVQGYWVVLHSDGRDYDYRASAKGYFKRCENSSKFRLPVG